MILDVEFEEGALFVSLRNIGLRPASQVSTVVEPSIRGLGGSLDVAQLPLLREIPFFAPGKQISQISFAPFASSAVDGFAEGARKSRWRQAHAPVAAFNFCGVA